jgi:hypothetical protein
MIQSREADLELLTNENQELGMMCAQLLEMVEDKSAIDTSKLSPRAKEFVKKQTPEAAGAPSVHNALKTQIQSRLSKTFSFNKDAKANPKVAMSQRDIIARVRAETERNLMGSSALGLRGIGEDEEVGGIHTPSMGDIGGEYSFSGFEKARSASRGAFDPDAIDMDPDSILLPPDQEMLSNDSSSGRHKRRLTATHRKRITRGQSFFKKLLDTQKTDIEEDDTVWDHP